MNVLVTKAHTTVLAQCCAGRHASNIIWWITLIQWPRQKSEYAYNTVASIPYVSKTNWSINMTRNNTNHHRHVKQIVNLEHVLECRVSHRWYYRGTHWWRHVDILTMRKVDICLDGSSHLYKAPASPLWFSAANLANLITIRYLFMSTRSTVKVTII